MRRAGWYGQARAKILRANRRSAEMVRSEDERDIGVRGGVEEAFGFGDQRGWPGTEARFRYLSHRWMTR